MRTLKVSALSFCILGTLFLSAPVFAIDYSITGLGTLGGSTSYAYGINNSGWVVGESDIAGNAATRCIRLCQWRHDQSRDLGWHDRKLRHRD